MRQVIYKCNLEAFQQPREGGVTTSILQVRKTRLRPPKGDLGDREVKTQTQAGLAPKSRFVLSAACPELFIFAGMGTRLHPQVSRFSSRPRCYSHHLLVTKASLSSSEVTGAPWGRVSHCPQKSHQMQPSCGYSQNKVSFFFLFDIRTWSYCKLT